MRRHVERAELGEVLSAEAEREDVGVKRFLIGAEDVVRRQVVGNLGVAQVSLDVEVTEGLNTVEAHAIEVGIVVNLGARTDGVAVRLADVEGNAQRTAAGSGVVKAQNGTVDVGFIAGTVAVEALCFVGRAEDVHPGGEAFRALRRGAAADGSRDLIIDVERRRERAAQSCHVRGSMLSLYEFRNIGGIELLLELVQSDCNLLRGPRRILTGFLKFLKVLVVSFISSKQISIRTHTAVQIKDHRIGDFVLTELKVANSRFDSAEAVEAERLHFFNGIFVNHKVSVSVDDVCSAGLIELGTKVNSVTDGRTHIQEILLTIVVVAERILAHLLKVSENKLLGSVIGIQSRNHSFVRMRVAALSQRSEVDGDSLFAGHTFMTIPSARGILLSE